MTIIYLFIYLFVTLLVMIRPTSQIQYLNINVSRSFLYQQRFLLFSRAFNTKQTPTHDFNVIRLQPRIATSSINRPKLTTSLTLPAQNHHLSTQSETSISTEMSSKLIPSDPDHVMVIRKVTPNIATFSVPFSRFGKVKIGGRGTLGMYALLLITSNLSAILTSNSQAHLWRPCHLLTSRTHQSHPSQSHGDGRRCPLYRCSGL